MTIDYTARRVGKALLQRVVPRSDFTFPLGFRGRLGNQLFQIAGTYSLARRHGAGIALRSDWPYRPYFDLPQSWFHSRLTTLRCRQAWPLAEEIPAEWRIYLQDLRVWDGRDEDIRMLLSLSQSAHDAAEAFPAQWDPKLGIHVT